MLRTGQKGKVKCEKLHTVSKDRKLWRDMILKRDNEEENLR